MTDRIRVIHCLDCDKEIGRLPPGVKFVNEHDPNHRVEVGVLEE